MQELVYILSHSYSGSTLLTLLLGTHPDIATMGELKARAMGNVDEYSCSCGRRIGECPFWESVRDKMLERGMAFSIDRFGTDFSLAGHRLGHAAFCSRVRGPVLESLRRGLIACVPQWRRNYRQVVEQNCAMIEVITRLQGGRLFLDGSKDAIRLAHIRAADRWVLKTIHLIRDGRGAAYSFMNHNGVPMERAAHEWRVTDSECRRILASMPVEMTLTIHYEDLCREPKATLDEIHRFLGTDPEQGTLEFQAREHHVLGNSMRLDSAAAIILNERWRTALKPDELGVFDAVAGKRNRQYGYE